jgi:galactokinase
MTAGSTAVVKQLAQRFIERFGVVPQIFRAPGRVNLIGEHTDYNEGFVLPVALDLAIYVACAPRDDGRLSVHSLAFDETCEFALDAVATPCHVWSDYVRGVVRALRRSGRALSGANIMAHGDLPMGAGLSSSAALEVAVGYALCQLSGAAIDKIELALLCQAAENDFVGTRCGVMDQLISCCGVEGHAILIDCRALEMRPTPIDPAVRIMICNTMVGHELAASNYNARREECERSVALLDRALPGVTALRDVTPDQLALYGEFLPDPILRRARHVVTENRRVLEMASALEAGDLARCGKLMNASHASLRDDYEVSCVESDLMAALAQETEGVFGARMTGGGFGGCVVCLVEPRVVDRFIVTIGEEYRRRVGLTPDMFSCLPSQGVGSVLLQ